jgi:hypothetical protein
MGVCANELDCVDVRKLGENINSLLFTLAHFPNGVDLLMCQLKALNAVLINVCRRPSTEEMTFEIYGQTL